MKTISLKLPDGLDARLGAIARNARKSKSAVVREAIEVYLDQPPQRSDGSCADRSRDLAGCLEGPRDLSSNKRHLRGYGR